MGFFDFFSKGEEAPLVPELDLPSIDRAFEEFLTQQDQFSDLESFTNDTNEIYRNQLNQVSPNLLENLELASETTNSMLKGEIPSDVAEQISRNSISRNLSLGVGNSSFGRNLEARDFGLTSLDIMNQGFNRVGQEINFSKALTPDTVSDLLFNPSQILQRMDQEAIVNHQVAGQNQMIEFANNQRRSPFDQLVSGTIGSVVSAPFNMVSNAANLAGQIPNMAMGAMNPTSLLTGSAINAPFNAGFTQDGTPRAAGVAGRIY